MIEVNMVSENQPKYFVPAAAKTIQILEALAECGESVTLQELIEHTGLPKSSVFVILATLESLRYVERDTSNTFRLGPKVIQIGAAAAQQSNLSKYFHQAARRIVEECGETVHLAILDQTEVIYVAREDGTHQVQFVASMGRRMPAHATGIGKALLATLPDGYIDTLYSGRQLTVLTTNTIRTLNQLKAELDGVRELGYAHDNQEYAEGLQCIAAPIYDRTGQAVASISASFLSARANPEHFQRVADSVKRAARDISERMGGSAPATKGNSSRTPESSLR
jgi:IclR family transcriptional regulator, KDG regulon repressor